ncbi:hypothetical protein Hdeb2414_s0017g00503461 [Helianthus debilis subsp. tardiflorus]
MKAGSRYESKYEEFLLNLHIFHHLEYNSGTSTEACRDFEMVFFMLGNTWVKSLSTRSIDGQTRYAVVGWHNIIEAEHISLDDNCFFNWSRTTLKLLVTKLQQVEMLE